VIHLNTQQLRAGLGHIRESPSDCGRLEMIVRRPQSGEREILTTGELSCSDGLVGDDWIRRPSSRTTDGSPHPDMQLTIINWRLLGLISVDPDRMALAGDQLAADIDLSVHNMPPGSRLRIGDAEVIVTSEPHTGCMKFNARYGADALHFVNSTEGRELRLRGLNAKVVVPGVIAVGDVLTKIDSPVG